MNKIMLVFSCVLFAMLLSCENRVVVVQPEAPKAEAPKAEEPKADAPKAEEPKVDAPKQEVKSEGNPVA